MERTRPSRRPVRPLPRGRSRASIIAALFACGLVAGCPGDGPGGTSGPSEGAGGGAGRGEGLPGTVLAGGSPRTRASGVIHAIDPRTGAVREHAIARPDRDDDTRYSNQAAFSVAGSGHDGVLLLSVTDCVPPLSSDSCVERVGADGSIERLFTLPLWIAVPAVASRDGSLVAAVVSPGRVDGPYELRLHTPRGEPLASLTLSQTPRGFAQHDWAPGNRLVYAFDEPGAGSVLVVAEPGSLRPEEGFPVADAAHAIGRISVGPDGGSIAYELVPRDGIGNTTTWVLDRASGDSTLVAEDDGREVFAPAWSPDGRHLLVSYGVSDTPAAGTAPVGSTLPFAMVVAWTGETVRLDPYEGVGRRLEVDDSDVTGTPDGDRWIFGTPFWAR